MVFDLAEKRLKELKVNKSLCRYETNDDIFRDTLFDTSESEHKILLETTDETTAFSILSKMGIRVVFVSKAIELPQALAHLSQSKCIGLDIETYGLPEYVGDKQAGLEPRKSAIRTVQLYDGNETVFVFDLMRLGDIEILDKTIWDLPMTAHNALFELKHLLHNGVHPKRLGCTLLADRVLNGNRKELKEECGLSKSATLKDLSYEILNVSISKELQVSDWSNPILTPEQIEYAALDAVLTAKLFCAQRKELEKRGFVRPYQILRDAQLAVAHLELTGIGFNIAKHRHLIAAWQEESDQLRKDILISLGKELNLNSGKQLSEWLNEALNEEDLESWAKTGKGQLSTSTHSFKLHEHRHDIFTKIIEYRHIAKRISSFGESLYKYIDVSSNRLYGRFSLGTTTTGRMASNSPNMQNMPRKDFRDLFCAKPGCSLIGLDYSQQELRVAALMTQDKELLQVYADGGDVHRNTAAAILKIPKEAVAKEQRQLAKAVIFGLLYGQGAPGLAAYAKRQYNVEMSIEEAEKHRENLFRTYKGLRNWQKQTGRITQITQKISTPCGRVRDFSRERLGYSYTAALNLPIQGAAAEITLCALIRIASFICEDCRLVNVVHDEILLEVKEEKAEEFAEKAKAAMEEAFLDVFPMAKPYLKGLIEYGIGKNWSETK
jgi:DNA polymerase-1